MLCFARVFLKCLPQVRLLNGESRRSDARAPKAQRRCLLGRSGDDEAGVLYSFTPKKCWLLQ